MEAEYDLLEGTLTEDIDMEEFREMVSERAYSKAEKRGFEPGHAMEDWIEAEHEIRNQFRYWSLG
jgi:hypothetical protein